MRAPPLCVRRFATAVAAATALLWFEGVARADPALTSPEQGFDLGNIQGARPLAMGDALMALGTSTTALYMNPANLPFSRVYHFEALGAFSPEARRQSYGGAVVDSLTNRIAGGIGGSWSMQDPDGIRRSWTDLRLSLALPLGDRFAVGATGRYLRVEQGISRGPLGASLASNGTPGDPVWNHMTFDLGATAQLGESVRIGAVGRNLTNPGTSLTPTLAGGGIGFVSQAFSIEADALADLTTWRTARVRAGVGAELFLAGHVPLRAGYRYDDGQRAHAVSLGVGYVDTKFSIELSGRRDVLADHPMTLLSLALRYFYDAARSQPDEPDAF